MQHTGIAVQRYPLDRACVKPLAKFFYQYHQVSGQTVVASSSTSSMAKGRGFLDLLERVICDPLCFARRLERSQV
eukprot:1847957-Lingulodinium_polyedra.AAC.1